MRSGFTTTKGALIRDILYPRPYKYHFYRDSIFVLGIMFIIALIGYLVTIHYLIEAEYTPLELFFAALDVIGVSMPA